MVYLIPIFKTTPYTPRNQKIQIHNNKYEKLRKQKRGNSYPENFLKTNCVLLNNFFSDTIALDVYSLKSFLIVLLTASD